MIERRDLTNQVFGRLTVVGRAENGSRGQTRWLCRCACGRSVEVLANSLLSDHTRSCGCFKADSKRGHTALDVTGQRFGPWLVLKRAGSTTDGKATWLCRCGCGNVLEISGKRLRGGTAIVCQRCESQRRQVTLAGDAIDGPQGNVEVRLRPSFEAPPLRGQPKDLTGRRFDDWTVVARAGSTKDGAATWHCRCVCGKERVIRGTQLTHQLTRGCGCARCPDLTGLKFGRWTVIAKAKDEGRERTFWRCRCGKEKAIIHSTLINGESKSCGCGKVEKATKNLRGRRFGSWKVVGRAPSRGKITAPLGLAAKRRLLHDGPPPKGPAFEIFSERLGIQLTGETAAAMGKV